MARMLVAMLLGLTVPCSSAKPSSFLGWAKEMLDDFPAVHIQQGGLSEGIPVGEAIVLALGIILCLLAIGICRFSINQPAPQAPSPAAEPLIYTQPVPQSVEMATPAAAGPVAAKKPSLKEEADASAAAAQPAAPVEVAAPEEAPSQPATAGGGDQAAGEEQKPSEEANSDTQWGEARSELLQAHGRDSLGARLSSVDQNYNESVAAAPVMPEPSKEPSVVQEESSAPTSPTGTSSRVSKGGTRSRGVTDAQLQDIMAKRRTAAEVADASKD